MTLGIVLQMGTTIFKPRWLQETIDRCDAPGFSHATRNVDLVHFQSGGATLWEDEMEKIATMKLELAELIVKA